LLEAPLPTGSPSSVPIDSTPPAQPTPAIEIPSVGKEQTPAKIAHGINSTYGLDPEGKRVASSSASLSSKWLSQSSCPTFEESPEAQAPVELKDESDPASTPSTRNSNSAAIVGRYSPESNLKPANFIKPSAPRTEAWKVCQDIRNPTSSSPSQSAPADEQEKDPKMIGMESASPSTILERFAGRWVLKLVFYPKILMKFCANKPT
jgi:hypothetical protein